ncbi:M1 family aminopeptidase [Flavobacterium sp. '19STA2R22 D10 B1']|uniref:M1 family aminopeptidase n=1 Tax=Flavobacterium aerium TaxID=3037261 RepID=UPI00278C59CD|nr:M1 family aminopeptidase [Flavobacterium sp. '19STA2R22 D10 B1']
MKKYTTILLLFSIGLSFAQSFRDEINSVAESEAKSARNITNFVANANTANYDVTYHRLRLTVNPAVQNVNGNVTTYFRAKSAMNSVAFDLANQLAVTSVKQRGNDLTFTHNNDELVITLPQTQALGVLDSLTIQYAGTPPDEDGSFVTSTHNGTPILWTLSEPYGARDWWPCKQDLVDKADKIDVYITAPSQYASVANGLQISVVNNSNGTKTTHFKHNYPIPAYLIAIAVTNYTVFTQQAGTAPNTFPIVNYLYPESISNTQNQVAVTIPIMNLYESLFGTYPFSAEKYGHAQFGWGGGMEHTTVSFMGGFSRGLIAHELGHQWFGDQITCGSWKDIWLNEGFATYLSGLVVEHMDGQESFVNWKAYLIEDITSQPGGNLYLTDNDLLNSNRIFSSRLSYNKGAMLVNMLRFKLGDTNFYQGIKNYLADTNLKYGYAKTPDLQAHLEAVSGLNLTEFFNDWLYGQGYPTYTITARNFAPGKVKIVVNQTQSHASVSFFEMPLPVRVYGLNGQQKDLILNNTSNGQEFIEDVPFVVRNIDFNINNDILAISNQVTLKTSEVEMIVDANLYPNPTTGILNIKIPENIRIEKAIFHNALGQVILESTNHEKNWDVSRFSKGVHFLTLITDAGNTQLKFIKD